MMISAWIILVISSFMIISHFLTVANVRRMNAKEQEKPSIIRRSWYVKTHSFVNFYVGLVLFLVALTFILEGGF